MTEERHSISRNLQVLAAAWSAYALLMAAKANSLRVLTGRPSDWPYLLKAEFVFAFFWLLATPVVWSLSRRFPLRRDGLVRALAVHVSAAFAIGVVTKLGFDLVHRAFLQTTPLQPLTQERFLASILSALDYSLLQYLLIAGIQHAAAYLAEVRAAEGRAAKLHADLAQAQLRALQMQLQPHFLFNTLHSISALVHEDPDRAETMIARLGDFLRDTLKLRDSWEITFQQETEMLRRYLDIECMRYGDRLRVDLELAPETQCARVPALLLQPLVENAFRHGLVDQTGPGLLRVRSTLRDDSLRLEVSDNGPGRQAAAPQRTGIGLANLRERLRVHYGDAFRLVTGELQEGGFQVTVEIPFRPAEAPL